MQRAAATLQGAQNDNTMAQKEFDETKTQFEMDADSELETLRCRWAPLLHTCSCSTHPAACPSHSLTKSKFDSHFGCTYTCLHLLGTQLDFAWLPGCGHGEGARLSAAILKASCRAPGACGAVAEGRAVQV